ncbi:hypothetical protein [Paracoccus yeei]|uniref:hypothetical protein n=1 Tax=Paracoccus yeei TaxID=147645 RepID=UPI001C8E7859|nr:hypothetical protein [Paracoccus yeei]MBY0137504.1 hypothetical protein [Paracoccus yeei]
MSKIERIYTIFGELIEDIENGKPSTSRKDDFYIAQIDRICEAMARNARDSHRTEEAA